MLKLKALFLFLLLNTCVYAQKFESISKYKVNYALAKGATDQWLAIRSFAAERVKYLLLVNPQTLDTKVDLANNYTTSSLKWPNVLAIFKNSAYVKSIEAAAAKDIQLQNAGIDHAFPNEKGITLTIDLCPSHKALDRIIFQSVFDEFKKIEQPAPLAISVSGKWMLKHEDDLNWLKSLEAQKELDITWVNHSYNHEVNKLPLAENFLLAAGTNLDVEVLENEKLMLKNGLTPSVFFRFPGLVSDKAIVDKIEAYGLIPIGSDAWLAKGQQPNAGSIVLIHGNGNEEIGVKDFIELLKNRQADVNRKQWLLFDLRQGLEKEFE
ncbi:polysaccharide deacetylase [Pedobacter sp. HDW13]|uniref:polysaccharide deacetylase family protein n=1 Tax=unclassified Pedobacter TaxID=2628915 RepID=UPI000F5A6E78|nr:MULTISPECIES: polysaccharide deacetylase [unclassified Pedobacter]QIL40136.1 polysaccharide deacetylase [Pedobacter sp. HDW13]RQO68379.1 polysaccharide deacetylase [Pedobacter sp. KBW01]